MGVNRLNPVQKVVRIASTCFRTGFVSICLGLHIVAVIAGIHISQETIAINMLKALKPSLEHDAKHVVQLL